MSDSPYDRDFYQRLDSSAEGSASVIVPLLQKWIGARRVVDFGCGDGGWLCVFGREGAESLLGLDGSWVDRRCLKIPEASFRETDLAQPIALDGNFDLAISLEVCEHLPPSRAETFVDELTQAAPVVLFSGAIPAQGGTRHVNEQWPQYWVQRFEERGFRFYDCLRWRVWEEEEVSWWYKQNLLLFAKEEALAAHPPLRDAVEELPRFPTAVVHPDFYQERLAGLQEALRSGRRPGLRRWLRMGRRLLQGDPAPRA